MKDNDNSGLVSTTASGLVTSSLFAALIGALASKGILSNGEIHEIYESALLSLEENHTKADSADLAVAYQAAREIIGDALNAMADKNGTPDI